jgi:hypothetical protein
LAAVVPKEDDDEDSDTDDKDGDGDDKEGDDAKMDGGREVEESASGEPGFLSTANQQSTPSTHTLTKRYSCKRPSLDFHHSISVTIAERDMGRLTGLSAAVDQPSTAYGWSVLGRRNIMGGGARNMMALRAERTTETEWRRQ